MAELTKRKTLRTYTPRWRKNGADFVLFVGPALAPAPQKGQSRAKDVQRTVQSAEVFAKCRLRETSADWTVRCTSPRLHSAGAKPNSRKAASGVDEYRLNSLSPLLNRGFGFTVCPSAVRAFRTIPALFIRGRLMAFAFLARDYYYLSRQSRFPASWINS